MKSITIILLVLNGFCCFAADETNIIVASDWSEPVGVDYAVRGRLLIVSGNEPAYGGPQTEDLTMMFVELQNRSLASLKLYFDVMGLKCELKDGSGKSAPEPQGGAWGGRGPFSPSWVVLPYNCTTRLFVNSGGKSPLRICPGGAPWAYWSIPSSDTNVYFLSGTLKISTPTNATLTATPQWTAGPHEYAEWKGTLVFPKAKISASQVAKQK